MVKVSSLRRDGGMKRNKTEIFYNLLDRWMTVHEEGKCLSGLLEERGIRTVAVYGLGKIGRHALAELANSNISVAYVIDKAIMGRYGSILIKSPDDVLPAVDAIIVTAVYDIDEVELDLSGKTDCPVISLEEMLYEG